MFNIFRCYLLVFVGFSVLTTAFAINCYQCQSTDHDHPYRCPEFFADADPDGYHLEARPCNVVHDAQFCIKRTGRFEGGLGTQRFCSALDLGNYCNYVKQPGDDLEYRSCVYTCSSDGCNPASRQVSPFPLLVVMSAMFAIVQLVLRRH